MKRVLVLLVVLLLVVSAAAACGSDATSTSDTGDAAVATATPDSGGDTSGDSSDDTSADSGDGDGWVKVMSMKGSTSKRSPSFMLEGGEQKLEYSLKGDTMPMIAVYVEQAGWDIEKEGGFPAVWPDEAGSDTTMLDKDAGEYIVQVEAANCDWTVTILEKR